eukprot:TRINITY_DN16699_c0_g1_i1.p1 TRINITY_DN16699_c0_g1~~TRINITY_DN16699_c0_g1_i1.p1  ORF type:complete len:234 (+),score=44.15 TRINITY_DN16699_c0_g1_i1:25-726(+)
MTTEVESLVYLYFPSSQAADLLAYVHNEPLPRQLGEELDVRDLEGNDEARGPAIAGAEELLSVDKASFWVANGTLVAAMAGGATLFLIALLVVMAGVEAGLYMMWLGICFPVLGVALLGLRRTRLLLLTNRRAIVVDANRSYSNTSHTITPHTEVLYSDIVSIEERLNWLFFMRELIIRIPATSSFSPTTISKQSGVKQVFIDGFPSATIRRIHSTIESLRPSATLSPSELTT